MSTSKILGRLSSIINLNYGLGMLNIVMNIIMWYQLVAWGVANRSHPPVTLRSKMEDG